MLSGHGIRARKTNLGHRRIQALLTSYLDGALSPQQQARVEGHARVCERCRAAILSPPSATRMLRSLKQDPPPDLVKGILARLDVDEATRPPAPSHAASAAAQRQDAPTQIGEVKPSRRRATVQAALAYCLRPSYLRRTLPVAGLAGIVLSAMYQLNDFLTGSANADTYFMCACNFLVAFVFVSLGPLLVGPTLRRRPGGTRGRTSRG